MLEIPKSRIFTRPAGGQDEVARLDVAVDDAGRVGVFKSVEDVQYCGKSFLHGGRGF